MQNFTYNIPTRIYFGKGQIASLGENLKKLSDRVLLVYGGGSIKKTGLYAAVTEQLQGAGIIWKELSGVEPNPKIESVRQGVAFCRVW